MGQNELDEKKAEVDEIEFEYPNQYQFPPKKEALYFDTEAFSILKALLYILTKVVFLEITERQHSIKFLQKKENIRLKLWMYIKTVRI